MNVIHWLSFLWKGYMPESRTLEPRAIERNEDAELAELAALIESGDASKEAMERMAVLVGQTDPNSDRI